MLSKNYPDYPQGMMYIVTRRIPRKIFPEKKDYKIIEITNMDKNEINTGGYWKLFNALFKKNNTLEGNLYDYALYENNKLRGERVFIRLGDPIEVSEEIVKEGMEFI